MALRSVRDASRAALSLQRRISLSQEAHQKGHDGTGFGVSPVTAADFMVQVLILGSLAQAFPHDRFIAEETGAELAASGEATRAAVLSGLFDHSGLRISEAEALARLDLGATGLEDSWSRTGRTWVLDPVDGTKGFLRGDHFAVALALLDGGQPVFGVLGCPTITLEPPPQSGTLFWAARGSGAFRLPTHGRASGTFDILDDMQGDAADASALLRCSTPLRVSKARRGEGLVRCEAFESRHSNHHVAAQVASRLGVVRPPIRMDGQGKYGMVAAGEAAFYTRLPPDGYQENIWDHAAGSIVVEEAGGRVTDLRGQTLRFDGGAKISAGVRGIVASNGACHDELLDALAGEG